MISTILLLLHWSIAVLLTIRLMVKKLAVGESLAWLFVIYSVPGIGALIYYAFGERRQGDKRIRNLAKIEGRLSAWQTELAETCPNEPGMLAEKDEAIARFVSQATGFPVVCVQDWRLLDSCHGIFDELIAMIDQAQRYVHLEFYIWECEGRVAEVHAALLRAVERGVRVRILADAIGGQNFLESEARRQLERAGAEVEGSMKFHLFGGRWDLRNHRKIVVVDGTAALSGSFNLADPDHFKASSGVGKWIDAMVRIDGAGAQSLGGVFLQDWKVEHDPEDPALALWEVLSDDETRTFENSLPVQVLPSGPGTFPESIHQVLMMAIYSAEHELIISTPYFVPSEPILHALIAAAMRGVRVTLIVPRRSDVKIATFAGRSHFEDLLEAGVQIGHFDGGLLHTKSITVDGRLSIFGTVNLDQRSLWLNSEVTLLIYHEGFTDALRALQLRYWEECESLMLDHWLRRPLRHRIAEGVTRLLSPVL